MEHDRQLRFLIPPLVFLASLFWGAVLDPASNLFQRMASVSDEKHFTQWIPLILAGGIAVVAMGFLISAIAIAILRVLFIPLYLLGLAPGGYEGSVSKDAFPSLWRSVSPKKNANEKDMLYAVGVFDHTRIEPSLHSWVGRRWNIFMVSVNCCVAIGLAHFVVSRSTLLGFTSTVTWRRADLLMVVVLVANAVVARRQALQMLGFAAVHGLDKKGPSL